MPLIQEYIKVGSIINSDSWGAYRDLEALGHTHFRINRTETILLIPTILIYILKISNGFGEISKNG